MSSCLQAHQESQSMLHKSKRSHFKVAAANVFKDFIGSESFFAFYLFIFYLLLIYLFFIFYLLRGILMCLILSLAQ